MKNNKFLEVSIRYTKDIDENSLEIFVTDITTSFSGEQEKLRTKYKGLTLAKIAHELKNPISTINLLMLSIRNSRNSNSK